MFCSGTTPRESRVFAHLILNTACRYFLPPFRFQIRVGGLYLLYSLYHSQAASPPEHVRKITNSQLYTVSPGLVHRNVWFWLGFWLQIRLALKDWEDVKKFEKDAVNAEHFDVIYILRQLKSQKAFHFTAMPIMVRWCLLYINAHI